MAEEIRPDEHVGRSSLRSGENSNYWSKTISEGPDFSSSYAAREVYACVGRYSGEKDDDDNASLNYSMRICSYDVESGFVKIARTSYV